MGGKIIFSNGSSQSRGVAILIPKPFGLDLTVVKQTEDEDGRILLIECVTVTGKHGSNYRLSLSCNRKKQKA